MLLIKHYLHILIKNFMNSFNNKFYEYNLISSNTLKNLYYDLKYKIVGFKTIKKIKIFQRTTS